MSNFEVGQEVVFPAAAKTDNYYNWFAVEAGAVGTVRKVGNQKILVRVPGRFFSRYHGAGEPGEASQWFLLEEVAPNDPNAPRPRQLGEKPEDGLPIDDPRIQWIFEDAGVIANKHNFCPEYDKLTNALGIPGRERNFTVKAEVNGLTVSVKVKARSRQLAEAEVQAKLHAQNMEAQEV